MSTKYTADPKLNAIARRLLTAKWEHPLSEGELEVCRMKAENPDAPRHMVSIMSDYKTWAIRSYIAGAQRIFGFVRSPHNYTTGVPAEALRYADMVRMYFWPYKRRNAVEPTDLMLNISAERAKSDLQWEGEVAQIIKDTEQYLKDTGAILPPDEMERQLQAQIKKQRSRPTAQSVMTDLGGVFQLRCDKMEAMIKEQGETLARLNTFLESLLTVARTAAPAPFTGTPLPPQPLNTCENALTCPTGGVQ
jgi:hypothetical protein